eukprot:Polyplicarium_translucidae@DN3885_c0_g1_i1.p1
MRRKPYIIVFSILEACGFVLLGLCTRHIAVAILALVIISTSASFCSAMAEALVVESTRGDRRIAAESVSDFISAKAVGSLVVAYFSGYLLEKVSKRHIFFMTASFPLVITVAALIYTDRPLPSGDAGVRCEWMARHALSGSHCFSETQRPAGILEAAPRLGAGVVRPRLHVGARL